MLRRAEEQGYRGTGGRRRVRTVTSEGTYEQNGGERREESQGERKPQVAMLNGELSAFPRKEKPGRVA